MRKDQTSGSTKSAGEGRGSHVEDEAYFSPGAVGGGGGEERTFPRAEFVDGAHAAVGVSGAGFLAKRDCSLQS